MLQWERQPSHAIVRRAAVYVLEQIIAGCGTGVVSAIPHVAATVLAQLKVNDSKQPLMHTYTYTHTYTASTHTSLLLQVVAGTEPDARARARAEAAVAALGQAITASALAEAAKPKQLHIKV